MSEPGWDVVPDHLIVPISSDLPGNGSDQAPPADQPAPAASSRFWSDDEKKQLVHIFRTAKTPEEIVDRSTALGHDAGIQVPLEGPGGAKWIMQFRQQNRGAVPMTFAVPDFAKGAQQPQGQDQAPPGDYEVLPADAKIDFGTASGLSPEEIRRRYESNPNAEMLRRGIEAGTGPLGMTPLEQHGFTAGLDTDIKAGANAALQFILHPIESIQSRGENVGQAYHEGRTEALARLDYLRMLHPNTAPVEEIGGALANPVGMEARGLLLPVKAAGYGAVSGFEDSNGTLDERLSHGVKTAAASAVLAPVASAVLHAPGAAVRIGETVLGGSPNLARKIVAKAIQADGKTGAEAGAEMTAAHANDVPYMLADAGDNSRGLLAAATREPGPTRTIARSALEERQAGLGERVVNAVERDLGPVANPHEVADQLMTRANTTAGPLYDAAYSRPGADTFARAVAPLLGRPSMKAAFANAYRIAQEEGRDPTTLGFELDAAGDVSLTRAPSWQTLDYVKRGMDDVVERYRDHTTGRLNLNTEGKAINQTLRSFIGAFDKANPDYAAARAAYGGPVRGIDAMNQGRKALKMTADDLEARMRDMTPFEKDMFALGTRRAMAEAVQAGGDTANVINTLVGTGKKRAMLGRLFGDRQSFGRFVDTLQQEKEGFRTFARGLTGSPTQLNKQDDAALEVASAAIDMAANGGLPIATAIKMALKFGAGRRGAKTKEQVAALLSETDPARFKDLASSISAEMERRGLRSQRINRAASAITRTLTTPTGQPAQQGQ